MTKYAALLRGINFGGNNKVEMVKLKKSFESLGFLSVATYSNSGNVIFSSKSTNIKIITRKIENEILKNFNLEIKVMVHTYKNIRKILDAIPVEWEMNAGMRPHIAFLWPEIDSSDILKQIELKTKVNMIKYVPSAILWNIELKNWSKDTVYKFTNGKISKQVTVRSINSVKKIYDLMK